ncbi:MAG: hypothetical protein ABI585_14465, partial [Betaproteobacteria bacterium]
MPDISPPVAHAARAARQGGRMRRRPGTRKAKVRMAARTGRERDVRPLVDPREALRNPRMRDASGGWD